jgi:hypothetical protein
MAFFKPSWFAGVPSSLGMGRGVGAGAVRGGVGGLGYSIIGGALMSGDQSQLAGTGFGAATGALMGSRWGRRGFAFLGSKMRSNAAAGGWFGRTGPLIEGMREVGGRGFTRRGLTTALTAAGGIGASGLIGSTILESNRPY